MRYLNYGAGALTLISFTTIAFAQDCPDGYSRHVDWVDCPTDDNDRLQCATLEVPLDYKAENSGTYLLKLVRHPASSDTSINRSVFYNPGGPGASAIGEVIKFGEDLQEDTGSQYHIVTFDPRGVGLSDLYYNCPQYRPSYFGPFNSDAQVSSANSYYSGYGAKCAGAEYREVGELIGTVYTARDIDAVFQALDEDGLIRYYGASYGTLLGATLSAMFPNKMDRVVLDGNINPIDYYFGLGDEAVADVDDAVANFFNLCSQAGPTTCALARVNKTGGDLLNDWDEFLVGMLNRGETDYWHRNRTRMRSQMRGPSEWQEFAAELNEYYGETVQAAPVRKVVQRQLKGDNALFNPDQSEPLNKKQAYALEGITCGDFVLKPGGSVEDFKRFRTTWQARSKYGWDGLITILYQCATWHVDAREKYTGKFENIRTKNPILFVQTKYDPVTPLISAEASSAAFPGSGVLVSEGVGHCSGTQPSKKLQSAVRQYFLDGKIPTYKGPFTPDAPAFGGANPKDTPTDMNDEDYIAIPEEEQGGVLTKKKKRSVEYPGFLLSAQRDVHNVLLTRRGVANIPAGCVPDEDSNTTTRKPQSTESSKWTTVTKASSTDWDKWSTTKADSITKSTGWKQWSTNRNGRATKTAS